MNKLHILFLGLAIAGLAACKHDHADEELGHHHHEHAEAAHMGGEIELEPEMAEMLGVATDTLRAGNFQESISVSGQIVSNPSSSSVVSAPTSGILTFAPGMMEGKQVGNGVVVATISAQGVTGGDANQAARAAMEAAKKEMDRLAPLHADGIVSTKDYNAAVAAYEQAKAAYSPNASSGRAVARSAGVITQLMAQQGQYVDAGQPIAAISSDKRLSLRADVPERCYSQLASIASASIVGPDGSLIDLSDLNGRRNGESIASQNGYFPIYFSFDNNGKVAPGAFVKVNLLGSNRPGVLSVPVTAISEQQGLKFVYEQLDEDCYRKVPVKTGAANGKQVEILSGLAGGENIVVQGVSAVRLAETSAVAPEGHSHNH